MLINVGIWVLLYSDTKLWSANICEKERNDRCIYTVICQFEYIIFVNTNDIRTTYIH